MCEKEDKKNWSTYCTNIYIVWGERKTETERERGALDEVLTSSSFFDTRILLLNSILLDTTFLFRITFPRNIPKI